MNNQESTIDTLISLKDFKDLLGIDDREDKLALFCLTTATYTIEQFCMRRFLRKKHFERLAYIGDLFMPLREYPVYRVLSAFAVFGNESEIIEPDFYSIIPDCGTFEDIPFLISFSRALQSYRSLSAIKVIYWAGYSACNVPADLSSACFELAAWNFNRYKGRRIGMTGTIRGTGKDGEHFELSMPENVKSLLEPYKRKTI